MKSLRDRILEELAAVPEQNFSELSSALGCSRIDLGRELSGPLKNYVAQDKRGKWSLVETNSQDGFDEGAGELAKQPGSDLARLCNYYLACIAYDDLGISLPLAPEEGEPDYFEVDAIPDSPDNLPLEACRYLLGRNRVERGSFSFYFGYPVFLGFGNKPNSASAELHVEPLILFPAELVPGGGRLRIDLGFPIINRKPFARFTNSEINAQMKEIVELGQEMKFDGTKDRFNAGEIATRLKEIRPEWPWKEEIIPGNLGAGSIPLAEFAEPGIYNRAALLLADKPKFTKGLESELKTLSRQPIESYADTALGKLLGKNPWSKKNSSQLSHPILEVLPMNFEQKQAVLKGLTQPLTIITGPPGTGKSQVVANLLINAVWSGKRVLFASKNNKAVDVVEERVNALGPRPVLLRLGSMTYQERLAEYLLSILSVSALGSDNDDLKEVVDSHGRALEDYEALEVERQRILEIRNKTDSLDRDAEAARSHFGKEAFPKAADLEFERLRAIKESLTHAARKVDREFFSFADRALWPFLKGRRIRNFSMQASKFQDFLRESGMGSSLLNAGEFTAEQAGQIAKDAVYEIDLLEKAALYFKALQKLKVANSLESIARREAKLKDRLVSCSSRLWQLWLRLLPARMPEEHRQKLGKYSALLKMVVDGEDISSRVAREYGQMLQDISHLLPCWAVTSLSAKGRVPFLPKAFDIVIFDEASQCDIASALPLLFRAKSAVIIGDVKQLSHISTLAEGQDKILLEKHRLLGDSPHWGYSYQSLFDLGATQVSGDNLVTLVEHHRSHADIINFANQEFYEKRLQVATKYEFLKTPAETEPGVRWVDIKGWSERPRSGLSVQNLPEAEKILEILRIIVKRGFEGSLGVVSPFRAQANLIREMVTGEQALASLIADQEFLVDTVHKFQGDEKDVMIFSPVVSTGFPRGSVGFLMGNKNLFNVAVTRAKAKLIVAGDFEACRNSGIKYLSSFASYAASLKIQNKTTSTGEASGDLGASYPNVANQDQVSGWEKQFYSAAHRAGFCLIPQYVIEKYTVDFLMVDGNRKLVIEIDGERYHRNWTGELCRQDQIRNQRLFELGYDVIRFWVYQVRDDMDWCLGQIRDWKSGGAS